LPTLKISKPKVRNESEIHQLTFFLGNRPPPPTSFSELDRLAYVVRAIESDCAVVPIGAFKLTPGHELRYDDNYRGLTPTEAMDINNWQHFRHPQSVSKMEIIQMDEAIFFKKFLDDLQDDQPKGCWSLQNDSSGFKVSLTSLLWPGFIGYHQCGKNVFGYAYFGNGLKNVDLPFML
jgi:radial spoke head protein 9